ncbi:MAG: hypothetical protein R2828_17850 [Saprospiraceae bacterium]
MKLYYLPFVWLITCFGLSCSEQHYSASLSPQEALKSFQLLEGYKIELFAAEPFVLDPVEMIFDENGDIYVVEMPDYPYKPEPGQGKSRIRRLVDTDGDGQIDQSTLFADQLSEATSVLAWDEGLIVTAAPNILLIKDTDNDGKADQKEVLFTGFFENNSEAQITNLRFSIDNWIYAANFGQAGEVSFNRRPDLPALSMRGGDFRFRLDRGSFELATGPTQFGQAIDDWGHRFMAQNTLHIRHAVIPYRYLHRHPYLPATTAVYNISDHDLLMYQQTPPPYWRAERTQRRQKSYEEQNLDRVEYAEDHFTGASGSTFYAGDAFPPDSYGNIFIGDVAGNLIHRDVLSPLDNSPTFIAKRHEAEQNKEFLASTDPWFRPVNFTVGPDGFLYVIDMYRQHIETPLSIPEDLKAEMDFLNGSQHGRIYRIMPEGSSAQAKGFPNLSHKTSAEYVDLLTHPNRWQRMQAQRLLLKRQDHSVEPQLRTLFRTHEDPRTRLHAFFVLEGLNLLDAELVKLAMEDPHPGIRENGIVFSEKFPECLPLLIESVEDSSPRVVLQASLSLGQFSGGEVVAALAKVMTNYSADPWIRTAVLSSEPGSSLDLFESLIQQKVFFQDTLALKLDFVAAFSQVLGARNKPKELTHFLTLLSLPDLAKEKKWQLMGLKGLAEGLEKSAVKPKTDMALITQLKEIEANADEVTKGIIQGILNL